MVDGGPFAVRYQSRLGDGYGRFAAAAALTAPQCDDSHPTAREVAHPAPVGVAGASV